MRLDDVAPVDDEDEEWEWQVAAACAKAALAEDERIPAAPDPLPAVLVLTSIVGDPAAPAAVTPRAKRATMGKTAFFEPSAVCGLPASTEAVGPRLSVSNDVMTHDGVRRRLAVSTEAPMPRSRPTTAPPASGVSARPLAVTPARVTRPPIKIPPKEEPGVDALTPPPRRMASGTAPIERPHDQDDPGALLREAFAQYVIADECPRCARGS